MPSALHAENGGSGDLRSLTRSIMADLAASQVAGKAPGKQIQIAHSSSEAACAVLESVALAISALHHHDYTPLVVLADKRHAPRYIRKTSPRYNRLPKSKSG